MADEIYKINALQCALSGGRCTGFPMDKTKTLEIIKK